MRDAGAFLAIRSTASLTATQQECALAKPYVPYDGPIVTRKEAKEKNKKFYFTGESCRHGHISQRRVKYSACLECEKVKANRQRLANPDRHQQRVNAWLAKNPERASHLWHINRARRRAREAGAEGSFTKENVLEIFNRQKGKCAECKINLEKYHIDHVMPLSLGGSNWPTNLQILCKTCNQKKHAKHPIDWAQENGRLL